MIEDVIPAAAQFGQRERRIHAANFTGLGNA